MTTPLPDLIADLNEWAGILRSGDARDLVLKSITHLERLALLEAAVKPIADLATAHENSHAIRAKHWADEGCVFPAISNGSLLQVTFGQCRAVREALSQNPGQQT